LFLDTSVKILQVLVDDVDGATPQIQVSPVWALRFSMRQPDIPIGLQVGHMLAVIGTGSNVEELVQLSRSTRPSV